MYINFQASVCMFVQYGWSMHVSLDKDVDCDVTWTPLLGAAGCVWSVHVFVRVVPVCQTHKSFPESREVLLALAVDL